MRWRSGNLESTYVSGFCALFVAVAFVGCSKDAPDPPETFPVTGKVVDANQQPLRGGAIYFRRTDSTALEAISEIASDGGFSLYTMFDGQRLEGAEAGEYQISVVPPSSGNMPGAVVLPETQNIQSQSNQLTIELPP